MPRRLSISRLIRFAVWAYGVTIVCLWMAVVLFADRAWPATLIAFGPRWPVALPLLPLAVLALSAAPRRSALRLIGLLVLTGLMLVVGFMDFRLGLGRASGTPIVRIMTQNLGESRVTAEALDRFLKAERIDVAVLQECPFPGYVLAWLGWQAFYKEGLCLVSRFPFAVLDRPITDPGRALDPESVRFEIDAPGGRFQLLNVHLPTIRDGLEALTAEGPSGTERLALNRKKSMRASRAARKKVRQETGPLVVAGDFNLPVESAIYRANWGDLRNAFSMCGRGFGHTKATGLFSIRIDHVLTSEHWGCATSRVLSSPYSGDHAPLVVDLVLVR